MWAVCLIMNHGGICTCLTINFMLIFAALKIHLSPEAHGALVNFNSYLMQERGQIEVKVSFTFQIKFSKLQKMTPSVEIYCFFFFLLPLNLLYCVWCWPKMGNAVYSANFGHTNFRHYYKVVVKSKGVIKWNIKSDLHCWW